MASPDPVEIEAKFDVLSRPDARALVTADQLGTLVALGPARRTRIVDRYLDAADGRLRESGWVARLRSGPEGVRLQLKRTTPADAAGIQRRTELDGPGGEGLDPGAWPVSLARRRLIQLLRGAVAGEVITLAQARLARDFGSPAGAVEISLDRTEVLVDGVPAGRLDLLEIEQRGPAAGGFDSALGVLGAQACLARSFRTKLGWAADVAATRRYPDDLPVIGEDDEAVRPDEPTPEAARRILRAQVRRLIERERAFLEVPGAEEIRRTRVATRRLRATWRMFGAAFSGTTPDRLRRRLRRLAANLSAVRDLDVLEARLETHLATTGFREPEPDALVPFRASISARRAAALAALDQELRGERHRRWLRAVADFVETPGRGVVPVAPPAPRLLREQVGGWIWSGFEALLGWEPLVHVADATMLHELRIEAKRLRDLVQAVAPIAAAPSDRTVTSLVRLQDLLGDLNDARVAAGEARAWLLAQAGRATPASLDAVARFADSQESEMERLRAQAPAAWRTATSPPARRAIAQFIGSF